MIPHLHFLDWTFGIVIAISLIIGIYKGLIQELFSLGFFILAAALAYRMYPWGGEIIRTFFPTQWLAYVAAFVSIFVLILVLGIIATWMIKKIFLHGPLRTVDRVLGGLLGVIRGILICTLVTLVLYRIPHKKQWVNRSRTAVVFYRGIRSLTRILPGSIQRSLEVYEDDIQQKNQRDRRSV